MSEAKQVHEPAGATFHLAGIEHRYSGAAERGDA